MVGAEGELDHVLMADPALPVCGIVVRELVEYDRRRRRLNREDIRFVADGRHHATSRRC